LLRRYKQMIWTIYEKIYNITCKKKTITRDILFLYCVKDQIYNVLLKKTVTFVVWSFWIVVARLCTFDENFLCYFLKKFYIFIWIINIQRNFIEFKSAVRVRTANFKKVVRIWDLFIIWFKSFLIDAYIFIIYWLL
jgi:hypothetical protein